jgi:hypothetical protein
MQHNTVVIRISMVVVRVSVTGREVKLNVAHDGSTVGIFKDCALKVRVGRGILHSWMHNAVSVSVWRLQKLAQAMSATPQFGQPRLAVHRVSRCPRGVWDWSLSDVIIVANLF